MKDHTRRAIAYIVGRMVTGKNATVIQDQSAAKQFSFSGDISLTRIAVHDHDQHCDITGAGGSGMYTVNHKGNGRPISIKLNGVNFEGMDYDTSKRYRGSVMGSSISIQDDEFLRDFRYSL